MVETFCLRLAAGMAASLLLLPNGVLAERFYRLHFIIVLCLLGGAAIFALAEPSMGFWACLGLALGGAMFGAWAWSFEDWAGGRTPAAVVAATAPFAALVLRGDSVLSWSTGIAALTDAASGAYLGLAITVMLLGHWYLIAINLTIDPLLRLIRGLGVAIGLRWLIFLLALGQASGWAFHLDHLSLLWLLLRIGAGLVIGPILVYLAWESAKIKSTQSATGILYAADVCIIAGELTEQLLMAHLLA